LHFSHTQIHLWQWSSPSLWPLTLHSSPFVWTNCADISHPSSRRL
jgi:hypothetical protein